MMRRKYTKIFLLLSVSLVPPIFDAHAVGAERCQPERTIRNLTAVEGKWVPYRTRLANKTSSKNDENFFAVTGFESRKGHLWASTYYADYYPVILTIEDNFVLVSGLRFAYAPPGDTRSIGAAKVHDFAESDVKYVLHPGPKCSIELSFSVDIRSTSKPEINQRIIFLAENVVKENF